MKIRKEFKVESAHIVRNCTSERCSHSIHGHSAVIEVFLESDQLDNAQMVYDFGLMKGSIKQFIDSMDHCYLLCKYDDEEFKQFIKKTCDRWIELPFNPSAEMLSIFVMHYVSRILENTKKNNGERCPSCTGVRYHETTTGYAECNIWDTARLWKDEWEDEIEFSKGVVKDWSRELTDFIERGVYLKNPIVEQQIDLTGEKHVDAKEEECVVDNVSKGNNIFSDDTYSKMLDELLESFYKTFKNSQEDDDDDED